MSHKKFLRELQARHTSWTKLGMSAPNDGMASVNRAMQNRYPGSYQVLERYDHVRGMFMLTLEFSDPKEYTIWLLRHG